MRDEYGRFYTGTGELYNSFRCELLKGRKPMINLWVSGGEGVHITRKEARELAAELLKLATKAEEKA